LTVYYRISDKGNPKAKLPHAGKEACLDNAIAGFGAENIRVIADNCDASTVAFIRNKGLPVEETSLGNSASFIYMAERIAAECADDDIVYLLEDDYLHLPGSAAVLLEGLALADYVTVYDHPDRYKLEADGGTPLNHKRIRPARIFVTQSTHWRETDSTTMTFACRAGTLKQDLPVWKKYTTKRNPDDFHGFMELTRNSLSDLLSFFFRRRKREFFILLKNFLSRKPLRTVISAVPAQATHAELAWLAPVVDWEHLT